MKIHFLCNSCDHANTVEIDTTKISSDGYVFKIITPITAYCKNCYTDFEQDTQYTLLLPMKQIVKQTEQQKNASVYRTPMVSNTNGGPVIKGNVNCEEFIARDKVTHYK